MVKNVTWFVDAIADYTDNPFSSSRTPSRLMLGKCDRCGRTVAQYRPGGELNLLVGIWMPPTREQEARLREEHEASIAQYEELRQEHGDCVCAHDWDLEEGVRRYEAFKRWSETESQVAPEEIGVLSRFRWRKTLWNDLDIVRDDEDAP